MDEDEVKKFCPNCNQLYFIQFTSSKLKGNWPLFLPCGHSMCENCIINVIKCAEPLECKVCFVNAEVTNTDEVLLSKLKLHQKFPIHVHMVGELTLNIMKATEANKNKPEEDPFLDLKALLKSEKAEANCLECHEKSSNMCIQCNTVMCAACFKQSHMNFVIFKNHKLQSIESTMPINCKVHKEKKLDYFCKDCKKPICMDCMMVGGEKSCKNHDVVSLQEVNETFLEELSELSPKVDEVFRRLTKTAVDIGYLLYNYDTDTGKANDLTKIIENVDHHFTKLCSIVQKNKEEVIKIIKQLKSSEKEALEKAKTDVSTGIKKALSVLNMISKASDKKKINKINIPALLEEAKNVVGTPWYLNRKESNQESLKVLVNEDLCSLINDYVHLEGNAQSLYKLCSVSELGDDVEIPPPPNTPVYPPEMPRDVRKSNKQKAEKRTDNQKGPTLFKNIPKYRSKSGSVSSNSVSSENSAKSYITQNNSYRQPIVPIVQTVTPFAESQHPQQLQYGSQELIYISHIMDPHNFYVQRACTQRLIKDMLREFRNALSFAKPSVNHITPGKTYLVYNKVDNMWQRCRVINVDTKDSNKPVVQVFCFDFGSTEYVSFDKLRLMPPSKIQTPFPLAINCSLANCVPINGTWTSDDSLLIQNIIDNKQAVIHVHRVIPISQVDFKLECDVTTFENGVSIVHALVFHERARMPNPKVPYPAIIDGREKPKLFTSNNDFKSETTELVTITHVVSPDNFYVRKNHLQEVYDKLTEELEQEYSLASTFGTVYLPEIGMVCAVNVEKGRLRGGEGAGWARALVTELPGRARVRLALPDSGHTLLAHWTALRYIRHKFTTLSALATECHLAGITPYNKQWSTASVDLLQQYEGKVLELKVEENRNRGFRSRGSIGVTLYDKQDNDNFICINNEMIRHKFAITFGVYMFNKDLVEEQVVTNKSPLQNPPPRKQKEEKIKILKRNDKKKVPQVTSDELQAKDKGPLKLEAKILHYQSPSHIYVALVQHQKTYNELFEKIHKYYSNNKNQFKEYWKVGDKCCVMCIQSKTWRRAVIIELDDENAKLFYRDFAVIDIVPRASLKELPLEFESLGNAALKCHLHGIMPAFGQEWPSLTKEYLKELLDAYKRTFITIFDNSTDESMPIEIWVYHTTQGSALEANRSEWRCLNRKIIEQGLGVPDKSQKKTEKKVDDLGDTLSSPFPNVPGSFSDWLLLYPVPLVPYKTFVGKKSDKENDRITTPVHLNESEENTISKSRPESSNVVYITDWLAPEPLPCKEFTALPTYIDNNGIIYLHDVSQKDTLDLIRKALDVRFKKSDPKPRYKTWTAGEPCVALFFLDNRFYRGRVLEVNKEDSTCLIHYIDYGNEELCSFENLRKSVPLHQIPTQAHKCVLNRIRPVGKQWDRQTLDYIHKSVVEKQCLVKISGEQINGVIPIELKFDKLWINDHLVDFEMAEYSDGTQALVRKFAPSDHVLKEQRKSVKTEKSVIESDSASDSIIVDEQESSIDGNYISYPNNIPEEFKCNITIINDINTLQLNIIFDDDTTKVYEKMSDALQTESANMTPLDGIFENKACVAVFPEDGRWYRASILQFSEAKNLVKVKYVDYGNVDVVSRNDTREINEEWVNLPPATVSSKLFGVQVNPDLDLSVVTKAYTETFLDQGPFYAKVMSHNDSVPFVELRKENRDLVYKNLIEDNIFIQCE